MLEDLDGVDWASLEHAYGEAADVPDLLRALLSTDSEVREEAVYELFGNIWHQGTVYPASAAAVPFLYELLTAPDVRDKSNIAHLLACIADGVGYLEVHAVDERGEADWRKILAESGKTLEREMEQERAEIDAVHRAASAGLRHLLPYLNDSEPEIRQAVAAALGNYPEHADWALPALEAAFRMEMDEDVREALSESQIRQARHRA
ncbi:MAG: HEAT repeat domain-containing protein [Candidatus Competibacteraceae bacterium]|nr:HEAT repeat domain-containing protein [Candidatus Competibacteraceae bacterium]MBK8896403.1 HEAT repeat domain-containing protein [Candidatus Competibacteraceae bacterium]MBK8964158.1 HEAT repeat domain-containing protein [Candidatus Competibacteraceae bacterium]MBK9952818.1 HEAT repeat domain-containing protein [Candidatus Competibacteraceae bacterium]